MTEQEQALNKKKLNLIKFKLIKIEQENCPQELQEYQRCFRSVTGIMFAQMKEARTTGCVAADFMREMIPHHRGAVRMSENALQFSLCPELVPVLDNIIATQTRGIQEMEKLLRKMQ